MNGRQILLRDVAEKIIYWIDKFKQVGDVAVNFDSVHASLSWAGIRLLLEVRFITSKQIIYQDFVLSRLTFKKMIMAESQQMKALLDGVERMTCLINRCRIYEFLHLQHEQVEQEELKQAISSLRSSLLNFSRSFNSR